MKRMIAALLALTLLICFAGCGASGGINNAGAADKSSSSVDGGEMTSDAGSGANTDSIDDSTGNANNANNPINTDGENGEMSTKILVAYFSRTGENYGVGNIEYGNTHIIADMIAASTGADMFEIARVTPYPDGYSDCTDEAKKEQRDNARPELTASVDGFDDYDVIFLGYPNWWGDMPMPVYTFLESYDFSGKTVIPFCTHAGSGLSSTVKTLTNKLTGAKVLDGLAVLGTTAQNDRAAAQASVEDWLGGLNIGG